MERAMADNDSKYKMITGDFRAITQLKQNKTTSKA